MINTLLGNIEQVDIFTIRVFTYNVDIVFIMVWERLNKTGSIE